MTAAPTPSAPSLSDDPGYEARKAALDTHYKIISDYIHDYEMDDGEHCPYSPTEGERDLIADAIHGLLADEEFVRTFNAWQNLCRSLRAGQSEPVASDVEKIMSLVDDYTDHFVECCQHTSPTVADYIVLKAKKNAIRTALAGGVVTPEPTTPAALTACLDVLLRMIPEFSEETGIDMCTDIEHNAAIKAAAIALHGEDRSTWPLGVQKAAEGEYE